MSTRSLEDHANQMATIFMGHYYEPKFRAVFKVFPSFVKWCLVGSITVIFFQITNAKSLSADYSLFSVRLSLSFLVASSFLGCLALVVSSSLAELVVRFEKGKSDIDNLVNLADDSKLKKIVDQVAPESREDLFTLAETKMAERLDSLGLLNNVYASIFLSVGQTLLFVLAFCPFLYMIFFGFENCSGKS